MNTRAACLVPLVAAAALAGCHSRGVFGYSSHPYTPPQLEVLLGDFPNPGPNATDILRDTSGRIVTPPADRAAYATELVAFEPGNPRAIIEGSNPREALGLPDYTTNNRQPSHAVSLGAGGSITLKLVGDPLMDVDGPDLFVFEVALSREPIAVEISPDGQSWTSVGNVPGGACAVDIGPYVKPGDAFHYVRLRDVFDSGDSEAFPGADIDAIAAVRSTPRPPAVAEKPAERITIPTEVLFGFDSDTLAALAPGALDRVAELLALRPNAHLSIEGHTDDVGDDAYNLALSERRAQAVKTYLVGRGTAGDRIEARGLGESRPVTANDSDEARRKNRRVELLLAEPENR